MCVMCVSCRFAASREFGLAGAHNSSWVATWCHDVTGDNGCAAFIDWSTYLLV
jgi:hypothetical protein